MKKRLIKTCINILYLHGWYVPLFLLLLGIKVFLLSLIADSIRHQHNVKVSERRSSAHLKDPHLHVRKNAIKVKPTKLMETVSWADLTENVVAEIPENLIDMEITPSAKNRTSSNSIWIVYNSVPNCKEEATVQLIEALSAKNGFSHQEHEYQTPWPRLLLEQEQESLVSWFQYQHLPKSYNRHFFFVNFTKYQKYEKERPIYMNLVRDPIDRLVLDYYSRRNKSLTVTKQEISRRNSIRAGSGTEWYHRTFEECVLQADPECRYTAGEKSFTLMIPFFCGQHNSCVVINDRWALQMAKFNIEREYSVVGVLEKMDQTLSVLEKFVPRFFSGAAQLYNKLDRSIHPGVRKDEQPMVSFYVRQIMETELYNEVELYRFLMRRLEMQYQKISEH